MAAEVLNTMLLQQCVLLQTLQELSSSSAAATMEGHLWVLSAACSQCSNTGRLLPNNLQQLTQRL
jgi:hypothetical protein